MYIISVYIYLLVLKDRVCLHNNYILLLYNVPPTSRVVYAWIRLNRSDGDAHSFGIYRPHTHTSYNIIMSIRYQIIS